MGPADEEGSLGSEEEGSLDEGSPLLGLEGSLELGLEESLGLEGSLELGSESFELGLEPPVALGPGVAPTPASPELVPETGDSLAPKPDSTGSVGEDVLLGST